MEPFTILCETCAAKLKVRRASMINQVLACPKCGNMVRVIPPDDLKLDDETVPSLPPQINRPKSTSVDQQVTAASQSDFASFEDIDEVIAQEQTAPTNPIVPAPPKSTRRRPSTAPATHLPSDSAEDNGDTPILPDQNWTSSSTQHRQKLILSIVAGVGILLLTIGAITAFVINSRGADDNKTANKLPNQATSAAEEKAAAPLANDTESTSQVTEPADTKTENRKDETKNDSLPEEVVVDDQSTQDPLADLTDPPKETPLVAQPESKLQDPLPQTENPLGVVDPLSGLDSERPRDPITGTSLDAGQQVSTRLGELNDLLSESGLSLSSIKDVADANRRFDFGKAKYFLESPSSPNVKLRKTLSNNVSGIQYGDVDLRAFLRETSKLVGVPISLHVESIRAAGLDLNSKINMFEQDISVSASIDNVLQPLKMKKVVFQNANQIVVLAEGWDELKEVSHEPHQLLDDSAAGKASLVRRIRGMFDEKTWTEQTLIEIRDDQLWVKQVPQVQYQIARLLEKLKAVQTLNANPTDQAAQEILRTEWAQSKTAREAALSFQVKPDVDLETFIGNIEKQANVSILIDWNSLSQQDWWPGTKVPGEFNEANVRDAIHQLARAMKISFRAIDSTTFELLSYSELDSRPELQVYAVKQILKGGMTSEVLVETLGRTFQRQGGLVQVGFDPDSQAIVVIAPQDIQTQFEAVLDRLKKGS